MGRPSPADSSKTLKRAQPSGARSLVYLGGALGLLALAAWRVPKLFDCDGYKPLFEATASRALGMRVHVRGPLTVGLLPAPHVSIEDGRIDDESGIEVFAAKKTRIWLAWVPLLRREFRMRRLELSEPRLSFERDPRDALNVAAMRPAIRLLGLLDGASVALKNGNFRYVDRRATTTFEAKGVELVLSHVRLAEQRGAPALSGVSLEATLDCRRIGTNTFSASQVTARVIGRNGTLAFDPVTMDVFGGRAACSLLAELSGDVPRYQLKGVVPDLRIEELLAKLAPGAATPAARGPMACSVSLSMAGRTRNELLRSAAGNLSLGGTGLKLTASDIDGAVGRFASSQNLSLVDIGAVFLAGPLGVAVTRGYSFAGMFRGSGGTSDIENFVSKWRVSHGIAQAQDVALATRKNRLALQGGLDLVNGRFVSVTLAVVDAGGCASVRQTIRGSFNQPVVEKPRLLASLAGPMLGVFRKARRLLPEQPCEVFYSGSVAPPR